MQLFSADPFYGKDEKLNQNIVKNLKLTNHISELSLHFYNFSYHDFILCTNSFRKSKFLIIFTQSEIEFDKENSFQELECQDLIMLSQKYHKKSIKVNEATQNEITYKIKLNAYLKALTSLDSNQASYLRSILQTSDTFCKGFCNYLIDKHNFQHPKLESANVSDSCSIILLHLTPSNPPLSYSWFVSYPNTFNRLI